MQQPQKHLVAHLELHLPVCLVILGLGLLLRLLEPIPDLSKELITFQHLLLHRR